MAQAMKLEGYLMKEKSKLTLLHGLTGDVNKRYFRIRNIEVGIATTVLLREARSVDHEEGLRIREIRSRRRVRSSEL